MRLEPLGVWLEPYADGRLNDELTFPTNGAATVMPFTPPMPSSPLGRGRFPSGRGELGTEANAC